MKFTKEEINLCKQVAARHEKELEYGGWFIWDADEENKAYLWKHDYDPQKSKEADQMTPLWTISDCLETLEKGGYDKILSFMYFPKDRWVFVAESFIVETPYKKVRREGKTKLEACLKAVLAVLEEK